MKEELFRKKIYIYIMKEETHHIVILIDETTIKLFIYVEIKSF